MAGIHQGLMKLYQSGVLYFFAFALGASVGSFLNVFIYRWPRGLSVFNPRRSFCPCCNQPLPWYLNLPVLSWLMLRGRCRFCGERISIRYLLVELGGGVWFVLVLAKFGPGLETLAWFGFGAALLAGSVIDLSTRLLPDVITLGLLPLGLFMAFLPERFVPLWPVTGMEAVAGACLGAGLFALVLVVFKRITGREGMGWGDVKLMGAIGAFLGYSALPAVIFIASAGGIFAWVLLKKIKNIDREYPVPFGPLLSLGALVVVMFREWLEKNWIIINWNLW